MSTDALPPGWVMATLGAVVDLKVSQVGPTFGDTFTYVDIGSIENLTKRITDPKRIPKVEAPSRARQVLATGDVLVSMTRPNLNAVALIPPELNLAIGSTGFDVLRSKAAEPSWIFLTVQSHNFVQAMCRVVQGALYPAIRPQDIRTYSMPLPPLPEQRRIVAKIEELFAELDAAVVELERVRVNLKRYRASVLKAAVTGELTADWRAKQRSLEPASTLLERILTNRRTKWEADQLAKFQATGKTPPKDWQAKYPEPSKADTTTLPKLPDGWCWASVEQLGMVQLGRQRSPGNVSKHFPTKYIRAANITEFGLDLSDVLEMEFTPKERITFTLRAGDIILSEASGSPEHVGKPAIWRDELAGCCFQNTVLRLRPDYVASEYLLTVFLHFYRNKVFAQISAGVGINHLSASKFSAMSVALPPLAEQEAIVLEVEARLSDVTAAEAVVSANLTRAARLRQSILKEAFAGRLVPQDPADEPAPALLERIQTTAASTPLVKSRRGVQNEIARKGGAK